jgi:hypothetical protein
MAYLIPRAFLDDTPEDKAAVQPVINQIMAYPLSQYDGTMKTKDWKAVPVFPDPSGAKPGEGAETRWVLPERYFDTLREVMQEVPPMAGEEALYGQINQLLDAAAKDPKIKATLDAAAASADADILTTLHQFRYVGVPVENGWTTPLNGAQFGLDYYTRTGVAKTNIFVNGPSETAYFYQEYDQADARLNGANAYTVTFAAGELPPVDGFWSLTLYNAEHFFAPNELNRYSLGTKNKTLKPNADGSLTIYVQAARPGGDKLANWLPAPNGDFELYIRAYWPKEAVIQRTWPPPPVVRLQ